MYDIDVFHIKNSFYSNKLDIYFQFNLFSMQSLEEHSRVVNALQFAIVNMFNQHSTQGKEFEMVRFHSVMLS